jgi:putative tricarboxylic transport membrane protein
MPDDDQTQAMRKSMENQSAPRLLSVDMLLRKDVLSGLLFIGFAVLGLVVSRDYPIGTALRMGTGYVPRLLCWVLLGLGVLVLVQGVRAAARDGELRVSTEGGWRPVVFVAAALAVFALTLERLGLVVAIALLTGIASFARSELRIVETVIAGMALILLSWAIFILGLGIIIPVWPEF